MSSYLGPSANQADYTQALTSLKQQVETTLADFATRNAQPPAQLLQIDYCLAGLLGLIGGGGGEGGGGDALTQPQLSSELENLEEAVSVLLAEISTKLSPPASRTQHTLILANTNTQYSTAAGWSSAVSLDANVRSLRFGIRGSGVAQLRYAFTSGKVAGSVEAFALRPAGYYEAIKGGIPAEIYFATDTANAVLELEVERA